MQSDVKVEQCDRDLLDKIFHISLMASIRGETIDDEMLEMLARHRIEASLRQPAPDALVERACDAFMSKITVDGNGGIEFLEEGIIAALSTLAPDLTAARIDPATIAGEG